MERAHDARAALLNAVLDAGINIIDTSPDYGPSEELIGAAIAHRRDEYFLASKCGCQVDPPPGAGAASRTTRSRRRNIRAGVEQSLRRHAHRPPRPRPGPHEPVARRRSSRTTRSPSSWPCATRARPASSGCRATCRTSPTTSPWACSTRSRSRTRRSSASTRQLISDAASGGRRHDHPRRRRPRRPRGAARAARPAARSRCGPGWSGRSRSARPAGRTAEARSTICSTGMPRMEFLLRFTLCHPDMHTTIVGHVQPRPPRRQRRRRAEGTAPARRLRSALARHSPERRSSGRTGTD